MTVEEVRERLEKIRAKADEGDDEEAHAEEDRLRVDVLSAIAKGEGADPRRVVRARDGYRCRRCGAERQGPRSLHLHHLKPWAGHPETRFDPDNIVTLCKACHDDAHRKGGGANQLGDSTG